VADRNYPVPRAEADPRFSYGLLSDVARAIESAGYPPLTAPDLGRLHGVLFGFIYVGEVDR
jgi:hypothetical protein